LPLLLGIIAGPLLLSLVTVVAYALFDPEALGDGQFALIYLATVPFGLWIGGVAGTSIWIGRRHGRRAGGTIALTGGLLVVTAAFVVAALGAFPFGALEILVILAAALVVAIGGASTVVRATHAQRWLRLRHGIEVRPPLH